MFNHTTMTNTDLLFIFFGYNNSEDWLFLSCAPNCVPQTAQRMVIVTSRAWRWLVIQSYDVMLLSIRVTCSLQEEFQRFDHPKHAERGRGPRRHWWALGNRSAGFGWFYAHFKFLFLYFRYLELCPEDFLCRWQRRHLNILASEIICSSHACAPHWITGDPHVFKFIVDFP